VSFLTHQICTFLRKYALFLSYLDARVIFRFPICCGVIFDPPNLHFFTQICSLFCHRCIRKIINSLRYVRINIFQFAALLALWLCGKHHRNPFLGRVRILIDFWNLYGAIGGQVWAEEDDPGILHPLRHLLCHQVLFQLLGVAQRSLVGRYLHLSPLQRLRVLVRRPAPGTAQGILKLFGVVTSKSKI
jgi:hypothetical protein